MGFYGRLLADSQTVSYFHSLWKLMKMNVQVIGIPVHLVNRDGVLCGRDADTMEVKDVKPALKIKET